MGHRMNELAGFSLQPSQTPLSNPQAAVAVGRWEPAISISTFPPASIAQLRANTLSSKHTPWRSSTQTAVNNLCASAIFATCAGFRCRRRA